MSQICSKTVIFLFSAYFGGLFCYHSNRKSRINTRPLHFGYCSNELIRKNLWRATFIFWPHRGGGGGKIASKGQTLRMKKNKKSKQLVGLAGWLVDWLRNKQTDSYILLHTALKHWPAFWGEGWGGTLILSYIGRFGPFLKVQNFELHFWRGEGSGGSDK